MSGWTYDPWRKERTKRLQSRYLKKLLYRLVFWMDDRCWQFTRPRLYRLTWNLYWKVQWPDDRSEAYPSVPW